MLMDPLYQEGTISERSLPRWKANLPASGKEMTHQNNVSSAASLTMTTPELEQALLSLAPLTDGARTLSREQQTLVDGFLRGLSEDIQNLSAQSQKAGTVRSVGESSPGSMGGEMPGLDASYQSVTFDGTVPHSPTLSRPASPRSDASSPSLSNFGVGDLRRESVAALAGTSLSALDPSTQDELKKQRKKERNRIAAMKCRRRRLEREMDLEGKVKALKQQNTDLMSEVVRLRSQVATLKQTVMAHIGGGCNVFANRA